MNHVVKKFGVLLSLIVLAISLVSCGDPTSNSTDRTNNSAAPTSSEPSVITPDITKKETIYPVTITGSDGVSVTLEKQPKKVVSGGPNITEILYQLGVEDTIIARTDYCDFPSEVTSIPSIGTLMEPNIEAIVASEPDLVIASAHFNEENRNKLAQLGIPVLALFEEHDLTGIYEVITLLGQAMNVNQEAATTVEDMKREITDIETKLEGIEAKTVYYVVGYGEYGDFTAGGDTFVHEIIEAAGGQNIASDVNGWGYNLETLLEKDPEYILLGIGEKEAFINAPNYKELTAVKQNKVFEIDRNLIDRQTYRNAQGVLAIAKVLHSDIFAE